MKCACGCWFWHDEELEGVKAATLTSPQVATRLTHIVFANAFSHDPDDWDDVLTDIAFVEVRPAERFGKVSVKLDADVASSLGFCGETLCTLWEYAMEWVDEQTYQRSAAIPRATIPPTFSGADVARATCRRMEMITRVFALDTYRGDAIAEIVYECLYRGASLLARDRMPACATVSDTVYDAAWERRGTERTVSSTFLAPPPLLFPRAHVAPARERPITLKNPDAWKLDALTTSSSQEQEEEGERLDEQQQQRRGETATSSVSVSVAVDDAPAATPARPPPRAGAANVNVAAPPRVAPMWLSIREERAEEEARKVRALASSPVEERTAAHVRERDACIARANEECRIRIDADTERLRRRYADCEAEVRELVRRRGDAGLVVSNLPGTEEDLATISRRAAQFTRDHFGLVADFDDFHDFNDFND